MVSTKVNITVIAETEEEKNKLDQLECWATKTEKINHKWFFYEEIVKDNDFFNFLTSSKSIWETFGNIRKEGSTACMEEWGDR